MKRLVVPVGSFMYMTNENGIAIVPERPVLVRVDEFIRTLHMQKKIDSFGGEFPDEATDAEWKKFFEESGGFNQVDVAVESFRSKWEGLDEKSLAQQAEATRFQLEQEARQKAEEDNKRAAAQLLADEEARAKAQKETADKLAEAERLADEKRAAQAKTDAEAKLKAEKAEADKAKKEGK